MSSPGGSAITRAAGRTPTTAHPAATERLRRLQSRYFAARMELEAMDSGEPLEAWEPLAGEVY